jgi:hypothetical protein
MMIFIILSSLLLFGNFHNHFIVKLFFSNFTSWQNSTDKKMSYEDPKSNTYMMTIPQGYKYEEDEH